MTTQILPTSNSTAQPAAPPVPPAAAPAPAAAENAAAGGKKVLIVDDNPDASEPLARLLRRLGLQAACAQSGPEALTLLEADLPDLMILDVMMPGMDGLEVLKRVRDNPRTAEMPVVIFSAITDPKFQTAVLEQGANDYWVKASLDFGKIRGTLGSLLEPPRHPA